MSNLAAKHLGAVTDTQWDAVDLRRPSIVVAAVVVLAVQVVLRTVHRVLLGTW